MVGVSSKIQEQHHNLPAAVLAREENNIEKLLATINSFAYPFLEKGSELFNLVTKVVMPEKIKRDLCNQSKIGRNLCDVRSSIMKDQLLVPYEEEEASDLKSNVKVIKFLTKEQV